MTIDSSNAIEMNFENIQIFRSFKMNGKICWLLRENWSYNINWDEHKPIFSLQQTKQLFICHQLLIFIYSVRWCYSQLKVIYNFALSIAFSNTGILGWTLNSFESWQSLNCLYRNFDEKLFRCDWVQSTLFRIKIFFSIYLWQIFRRKLFFEITQFDI